MSIRENNIFHLKDKIRNDLEIMKNCITVEQKRLSILKNLVVDAQRYEVCAILRDIEKSLEEAQRMIKKY